MNKIDYEIDIERLIDEACENLSFVQFKELLDNVIEIVEGYK